MKLHVKGLLKFAEPNLSSITKVKGKSVPRCSEGSRKSGFTDYVTMAQDGGRLSALRTGRFLPPGNTPGTHFC